MHVISRINLQSTESSLRHDRKIRRYIKPEEKLEEKTGASAATDEK
jgi:hypothetical protein